MARETLAAPAAGSAEYRKRKFFWKPRPKPKGYWKRNFPFFLLHVSALAAVFTGISWPVVVFTLVTFWARVFFVTGFYHRYFSHRSFKTSRPFQFVMGVLGTLSMQKGPLWWSSHHRHHHSHSDDEADVHSPRKGGFWWAHIGWLTEADRNDTRWERVKDLSQFAELRWLESAYPLGALAYALITLGVGFWVEQAFPQTGATMAQFFVFGFVWCTVGLMHTTYMINSGSHMWGSQRYRTDDDSRNNLFLALLTLGEGWHNNHHRYPGAERNGFFWYEIDITHYLLSVLSWVHLIWDLREPPERVLAEGGG